MDLTSTEPDSLAVDNRTVENREILRLSVVVPCFNEESVLGETHQRLVSHLETLHYPFEIIYVNDGSTDGTSVVLAEICAVDPRARAIEFSRNFGHQLALTAGIEHASGDAVILIDADLQDPPNVIEQMISSWREGADVVFGVRRERAGETVFKRVTAAAFYRVINLLSNTPIPLDTGDFRLMNRKVVDALLSMPERDRFLRGMVSWVGFRQAAVEYSRAPRFAGETKYPLKRMLRFATDGVLSFSTVPLRIAIWMGFAASGFAFLGAAVALGYRLFTTAWVPGWASLLLAILFMGGIQLVCLGIIGEYVGRIYGESKRRPLYIVSRRFGFHQSEEHEHALAARPCI